MKNIAVVAILSLAVAASGAWAQGKSGGAPGGGPPGGGGGSPFPAPTPGPAPTPMPTITPSTPIGGGSGGSTFGTPAAATDPLSTPATPLAPAAGSAPPVDRYRELHGHAHAHLCKAGGCEQYCDGRESRVGADKRDTFVRQCRSYCMEKC